MTNEGNPDYEKWKREQERIELEKEIERITIEGCGTFYPLSEGGGVIPWQGLKERYGKEMYRQCSGEPNFSSPSGPHEENYCARCYELENKAEMEADAALARFEQMAEDRHFERIGGCGVPDSWEPWGAEY